MPETQANDQVLQAKFDSIASKLHVQHLQHWWTLVAKALNAPARGVEASHLQAAE